MGEVPKEDALVEECEAFLHPVRRATCYYDHASDMAEYYGRTNDEHEKEVYLKLSGGLCEVLVRDGYEQWNRDTCMRSVGRNIGTTHVDVGAEICTDIGSVNERDGCYKDIADIHVEREPLVSGKLCSSISAPELQEPCILAVANTLLVMDKTAAVPFCQQFPVEKARIICLRRAKAGDNECDIDLGERCDTHPTDCPCPIETPCFAEREFAAPNGCYTFSCGDGYCDVIENYTSCCKDCGCPQYLTCIEDICQLRARGEECTHDKQCDTRHCIQGICDLVEDGNSCGADRECFSGYCEMDTCTPPGLRGAPCDRTVACITRHCSGNVCITLENGDPCILDPECTSYHCLRGYCGTLGVRAGCTYDIECKSAMCVNSTCYGLKTDSPCTFHEECESYLCENDVCIKRSDGMNCTSSKNCMSGFCSNGFCCLVGMRCCQSKEDCTEGAGECGSRGFCVYLDEQERDMQNKNTLLWAGGVLLGSIVLAVGGIKLAYALSGAVVDRLLGVFDEELGFAMMCQKCGKRPATRGGLCTFCATGAYHKEREAGTLSAKEKKRLHLSESTLFENKAFRSKMDRAKKSGIIGRSSDGIYSYFIKSSRDKGLVDDEPPSTKDTKTRKSKPSP